MAGRPSLKQLQGILDKSLPPISMQEPYTQSSNGLSVQLRAVSDDCDFNAYW